VAVRSAILATAWLLVVNAVKSCTDSSRSILSKSDSVITAKLPVSLARRMSHRTRIMAVFIE